MFQELGINDSERLLWPWVIHLADRLSQPCTGPECWDLASHNDHLLAGAWLTPCASHTQPYDKRANADEGDALASAERGLHLLQEDASHRGRLPLGEGSFPHHLDRKLRYRHRHRLLGFPRRSPQGNAAMIVR
jgi:hypothetical protein